MFEKEVFETPPQSFELVAKSDEERAALAVADKPSLATVPRGLDEMAPGPRLAAILATIQVSEIPPHDRVTVMRASQRMASHHSAGLYEAMSSLQEAMLDMGDDPVTAQEAAAYEIRAGLRLTRRAADSELAFASDLHDTMPEVAEALSAGMIDLRRAKVIWHGTAHLNSHNAAQVAQMVIARAPRLTTGQLGALVRKLCFEVDPDETEARFKTAIKERRFVKEATDDGTANLFLLGVEPARAIEAFNHVNHLAMSLKSADEDRTLDQIRSDVALDLLIGRLEAPSTGKGTVNIHVDLTTLAELDDHPGELAGFGPVIADLARQVTKAHAGSAWKFRVTDPGTSLPTHIGTTRRRPTSDQRRHVELRDLTCIFPGCRAPAAQCDIDHTIPYSEGGATSVENLAPLDRHDHVQRHVHGWTYRSIPGGDYEWTSRLGHKYTTSGLPPPDPA